MKSLSHFFSSLAIFLLLITSAGCKKDQAVIAATVLNTGPIAADGCDWVIRVDSVNYHPKNLGDKFKVDGAKIEVAFDVLPERFQCGMVPLSDSNKGMQVIRINKISKAD